MQLIFFPHTFTFFSFINSISSYYYYGVSMTNIKRLGILIILLGIIFGIETFTGYFILSKLWPIFIVSLGAGFVGIFIKRNKHDSLFLGWGVYLCCFSILAFFCNFLSWTILTGWWPLFIGFFGVSFLAVFIFSDHHKIYLLAALFFISISIVFLLIFSVSYKFWWTTFIFFAAAIFISENKQKRA